MAKPKHGMCGTPSYNTWQNLEPRSQEWSSFATFVDDMGLRPKGMQLFRIDTTKEFSKSNCIWAAKTPRKPYRGTATHNSWCAMMQRCYDVNSRTYPRYGGKGIRVCDRWHTFRTFLADMGERPTGATLDRFPNRHGNYEPTNCRWATRAEQRINQDRIQRITLGDKSMLLTEWAAYLGLSVSTLHSRLFRLGWSVRDALSLKPAHNNRYR